METAIGKTHRRLPIDIGIEAWEFFLSIPVDRQLICHITFLFNYRMLSSIWWGEKQATASK